MGMVAEAGPGRTAGISQGDGLTRKLRRQQHRVARPAREAGDRVRNAQKEGQLSCQGAPLLAQAPLGLECCDGCVLMLMEYLNAAGC